MHPFLLDKESSIPLSRQLYEVIKNSILSGKLREDDQLPATRQLSKELLVSRNTVMLAYEQLLIEGYLVGRPGSGTFVTKGICFDLNHTTGNTSKTESNIKRVKPRLFNFYHATPDSESFPITKWRNCLRRASDLTKEHFGYTDPLGIMELRQNIAEILLKRKGLKALPQQILITTGTLGGIKTISKFLRQKENEIIVESPCYGPIISVLNDLKFTLHNLPVDRQGIMTDAKRLKPFSCSILVTPSNHFPSGAILPIKRRLDLIKYAQDNQTYIIENDYNSDFYFRGMPVQSMHFLAPEQVIHIGTFSASMYPSLRLGYMVIPNNLIGDFTYFFKKQTAQISSLAQLALMSFIETGDYEKHLYKMNKLYARRRAFMITELERLFQDEIEIREDTAGLFLVVKFKDMLFDSTFPESVEKHGIKIYTYYTYTESPVKSTSKLLLGYANICDKDLTNGLKILKEELKHFRVK